MPPVPASRALLATVPAARSVRQALQAPEGYLECFFFFFNNKNFGHFKLSTFLLFRHFDSLQKQLKHLIFARVPSSV